MASSLLLAADRLSLAVDPAAVFAFWTKRSPGSLVSDARYRWELTHARAGGAEYAVPWEAWKPWRPKDARVISREGEAFELRLTLPISIADGCEVLSRYAEDPVAAPLLEEAEAIFRRDLATFVQASHAWKDTFALCCLCRRSHALARMRPFAIAIAACYTPEARREGSVRGRRFPFHDVPLVSATAMLAQGLLALGQDTRVVSDLATFVREAHRDGGWGDDNEAGDVLTTWAASDLLAGIDPSFDASSTVRFFADAQRTDGTWRALGPEVPWLTDAIDAYLDRASRPFFARFRFPHPREGSLDHKTGLPSYAYFVELSRLMQELPGLATATCPIAFMDLAGFRAFNNRFGQDLGDAVLRSFATELAATEHAVVIRDGGDEFLLVGAPERVSFGGELAAFRERWQARFSNEFPGADPVVARALFGTVRGESLRAARETLGRAVGALKHEEAALGHAGIYKEVGAL